MEHSAEVLNRTSLNAGERGCASRDIRYQGKPGDSEYREDEVVTRALAAQHHLNAGMEFAVQTAIRADTAFLAFSNPIEVLDAADSVALWAGIEAFAVVENGAAFWCTSKAPVLSR